MLSGAWYDTDGQRQVCESRLREMHAAAEQARLARQARKPRHLWCSVGNLLIAAGQALGGGRSEPELEATRQRA